MVVSKKLQELQSKTKIGLYVITFISYVISIMLLPQINNMLSPMITNNFLLKTCVYLVAWILGTMIFPIIGAVILIMILVKQ